ncbi:MAG: hypothetical protein R3E48_01550 [Burkholderiaceae bacterium]
MITSLSITLSCLSWTIVIGPLLIAGLLGDLAGGTGKVIDAARAAGKLDLWPSGDAKAWIAISAAFLTMCSSRSPRSSSTRPSPTRSSPRTSARSSASCPN